MKCPYNPNHVKFVEEMELHLEICPDMLIFGTRTGSELIFHILTSNRLNNYLLIFQSMKRLDKMWNIKLSTGMFREKRIGRMQMKTQRPIIRSLSLKWPDCKYSDDLKKNNAIMLIPVYSQPKNIKKRYEKIYHPDAQLVLTSSSNANKAKMWVMWYK
jgi:U11-48K-like CHHC zinc finger